MGRSQVKYRTTHGRGRGRGRGDTAGGRGVASGRGRPSHLRNLGSNAYRFEEREEEEQDDGQAAGDQTQGGRTQFFALEQNYREKMGVAPGEYFQSRAMKQWEEKDDAADSHGAVGVLVTEDEQELDSEELSLELVSPDIRYRIDPKYCIDLPFEPQEDEDSESDIEVAKEKPSAAAPAASAAAMPKKPAKGDAELDFLLNLSASTSSGAKSTPSSSVRIDAAPAPTKTPAETEQLEEWLDDVLDM